MGDREKVDDKLSVTGEFCVSMGESEGNSPDGFVPLAGNGPVSCILDNLGRLNRSKRDFRVDVSKRLSFEVVIGGRELTANDR